MWNLDYVRTLFGCGNYISIRIHKIARVACNGSIPHWSDVRGIGGANILSLTRWHAYKVSWFNEQMNILH